MPLVGTLSEQQAAAYAAEDSVTDRGPVFANLEQVQAFVDSLTAGDWWAPAYPDVVRVDVVASPTSKACIGQRPDENGVGKIAMAPWGFDALTICHEVAHVVEPNVGHEAPWARAFMTITYHALGSDIYLSLYNAFEAHGVKTK